MYKKYGFCAIIILVSLLLSGVSHALPPIELAPDFNSRAMGESMQVLQDGAGDKSLADALNSTQWQSFKEANQEARSGGVVWLRMRLTNTGDARDFLLALNYPRLAHLNVYTSINAQTFSSTLTGDRLAFDSRPINHRYFLFPLTLKTGDSAEVLVRLEKNSRAIPEPVVWSETAFFAADTLASLLQGSFLGLLFIMVIYNGSIFLATRDPSFAWYSLFLLSCMFLTFSWQGFGYQYIWPNSVWLQGKVHDLFLLLALAFVCRFVDALLALQKQSMLLHQFFRMLSFSALVVLLASLVIPSAIIWPLVMATYALVTFSTFIASLAAFMLGDRAARYFIIASASVVLMSVILLLVEVGVVPAFTQTLYALQIGSALGVMLWSLALADRINSERSDRFAAQTVALEKERLLRVAREKGLMEEQKAREAERRALKLERKNSRHLEMEVKRRTEKLKTVLRDLSAANGQLETMSNTDGLTGLANRRHFDDVLTLEWKMGFREGKPLSLLLVDLDFFKRINDDYGHQVGDACLQEVARVLLDVAHRPRDIAARYGGEEFVVILPDTPSQGAQGIAELIRSRVEALVPADESAANVRMTTSVGLATIIPENDRDPADLIAAADAAVYQAKDQGRNQVVVKHLEPRHKMSVQGVDG